MKPRLVLSFQARALIVTLAFGASALPLLHSVNQRLDRHIAAIKAHIAATQQDMRQLDDDIAMSQTVHTTEDRAALENVLAPTDRLQIANRLERQAQQERLDHFDFTLSPEQKIRVDMPSGPQALALSTIDINADAALDTDIYSYLEHLRTALPGRLRLTHLSIEHLAADSAAPTLFVLHFSATLEWLANGTETVTAGNL